MEVLELRRQVDPDVRVVDDALLEGGDELGRPRTLDGLVDLEHPAAELAVALDEMDLVAHVAEGGGGRHAGHAAADHDRGV